jgi:hypothetical protein
MSPSRNVVLGVLGGAIVAAATATGLLLTHPKSPSPATPSPQQIAVASAASPPAQQAGQCPTGTPLDLSDIAGDWVDARSGAKVTIVAKGGSGSTAFTLHGAHDWDGSYAGGKLTFTRKPLAAEMDLRAPEWARKTVEGQIEWSMELTAIAGAGKHLCGPWYPGLMKIDTQIGQENGSASVVSKGDPVAIDFTAMHPAILRVVALDDQTGFAARGIPYFPYPFPVPPKTKVKPDYVPEEYNSIFFAVNPYLQETEIYNASHTSQYQRAPDGHLYIPNQRRTLYVAGQGLPHKLSDKIDITAGLGSQGMTYRVVAVSNADNPAPDPQYAALFARGKKAALLNVDDQEVRDMFEHGDAMLVSVGFNGTGVLPGYKDFKINDITGNSEWRMSFGDDRAIISFGRRTGFGEYEITDKLFLPERTFIEVRTETALPIDKVDLHVGLNGRTVTWAGSPILTAFRVPSDPTGTTYRTANIELVQDGNAPSKPEPGLTFLHVNDKDHLEIGLVDPGLLEANMRPATVYGDPLDVNASWRVALQRAAAAAGVPVADWRKLPGAKATEISNTLLSGEALSAVADSSLPGQIAKSIDFVRGFFGYKRIIQTKTSTSVTVGDMAALILYRDTFLYRMQQAMSSGLLPKAGEASDLRGLREALKPSAWDTKSAWSLIEVTCPNGFTSCAFSYALDDDYLKRTFGADQVAAEEWAVKATGEALQKYRDAAQATIVKLQNLKDSDAEGMLEVLGADCVAEPLDLPCGYKALRPLILPNMMELVPFDANGMMLEPGQQGQRHLWRADLNARYTLRNLNTLITAVKKQQQYASLDRNTTIAIAMAATAPVLGELGAAGQLVSATVDSGGVSLVYMGAEVPEYLRVREEIQFAQGASLVLGQERLSTALAEQDAFYKQLLTTVTMSLVTEAIGVHQSVSKVRAAAIQEELKGARIADLLKTLKREDQLAIVNTMTGAKILEDAQTPALMGDFEREMAAAGDTLVTSPPPPNPSIAATGDVTPKFAEEDLQALQQEPLESAEAEPPLAKEPSAQYQAFELPGAAANTAEMIALQRQLRPAAGTTFEGVLNGKITRFKLGARIGEPSAYASVFDLVEPKLPGCEPGCVIKIYGAAEEEIAAARDIVRGSRLLGEEIPQPRLLSPDSTAGSPYSYLIQEKLQFGPPGDCTLCFFTRRTAEEAFLKDPALGDALLELVAKIKDRGLGWTDGNLPNMYFKRAGSKWVAGVLDSDFIIPYSERVGRLAKYFGKAEWETMQTVGSLERSRRSTENALMDDWMKAQSELFPANNFYKRSFDSLSQADRAEVLAAFSQRKRIYSFFEKNPGPYFPDAEFMAEKMLERKRYIRYDPVENEWYGVLIDPGKKLDRAKFERYFPKMFQRDRLAPIDVSKPFGRTSLLFHRAGGRHAA